MEEWWWNDDVVRGGEIYVVGDELVVVEDGGVREYGSFGGGCCVRGELDVDCIVGVERLGWDDIGVGGGWRGEEVCVGDCCGEVGEVEVDGGMGEEVIYDNDIF